MTELDDNERETARAIGALEASVKHLTETWKHQDDEATEGRRRLHEKLDELKSQQEALAATVAQQTRELAEIKPAIESFKSARDQQIGAQKLGKLLWGAFLAAAGGVGYVIGDWLHLFWPPKH